MVAPDKPVRSRREPDERQPQQRRLAQFEAAAPVCVEIVFPAPILFAGIERRPVLFEPWQRQRLMNYLQGLLQPFPDKSGSQNRMAFKDLLPYLPQGLGTKIALDQ